MKIKASFLAAVLIVSIFGGILLTTALGWWQTQTNLTPISARFDGMETQPDPAGIRGSFGFAEISEIFDIPLETLAAAFMLPDAIDPQYFYNRDMEGLYGSFFSEDVEIGNSSMQLFVALYKGIPFDITEDIYLPQTAVDILISNAALSEEQMLYLNQHKISIDPAQLESALSDSGQLPEEEHDEDEMVVKGNTTFYDVLQWGVAESEISAIFDGDMPPTAMLIKDYCSQNSLDFAAVKSALQLLVDAAQE
jgi:hypothetical protein